MNTNTEHGLPDKNTIPTSHAPERDDDALSTPDAGICAIWAALQAVPSYVGRQAAAFVAQCDAQEIVSQAD